MAEEVKAAVAESEGKNFIDAFIEEDLAAVVALASSYLDRPVPRDLVAIGEVGLTGELRTVNQLAQRISEVRRLGFTKCVVPAHRADSLRPPEGLRLIPVRNIGEAIRAALRQPE